MKKRIAVTIFVFFGVLLLAEVAARIALPLVPDAAEVARNRYRYRGWPEYMAVLERTNENATLVLLTNCQGYGGEHRSSQGYPARLRRNLREQHLGGYPGWTVMNWAVDGVTSIEYMIMAAYLREHPPAVVMAATSYADYHNGHYREGLTYCRSDVPRLALRRDVMKNLPKSFVRRHTRLEDNLAFWLSDRIALLRFKEYMWAWLERRFPGLHSGFYAPNVHYIPWRLPKHALVRALRDRGEAFDLHINYDETSREMLREYVETLSRIPTRVIVIAEPFKLSSGQYRQFLEDLEQACRDFDVEFWDMHDMLEPRDYVSSAHLHRRGHRKFAALIAERLAASLGGGAETPEETENEDEGED